MISFEKNLGMNGAQFDTSSASPLSNGSNATHASLLQPISMQNLLAMACMGQSPLSPTASSQTISSAQLGPTTTTPLCKFFHSKMFSTQAPDLSRIRLNMFHLFRVSTRICCCYDATICQWAICSITYKCQCLKCDCINCGWKANRRYFVLKKSIKEWNSWFT